MNTKRGGRGRSEKLYTLTEISRRAQVSMPTLQRYKREYPDRIPSVGKGRKKRYPAAAMAVFKTLKEESLARRRRAGSGDAGKVAPGRAGAAGAAKETQLLTLTEIERRTGISYPTLLRYVDLHGHKIPHEGTGRKRRYHQEAVAVFKELRAASTRGRRKQTPAAIGARERALEKRVKELEKAQSALARQLRSLERRLEKPLRVTVVRT